MCCLCHFQRHPDSIYGPATMVPATFYPRVFLQLGIRCWQVGLLYGAVVAATATVVRLARIIDASGNYALDPSFELKRKNIDCTTHFRLNEKPTTGQHEWQATGSHFRSNEKKNDRKSRKTIESLCRLPDAGYRLASSIK